MTYLHSISSALSVNSAVNLTMSRYNGSKKVQDFTRHFFFLQKKNIRSFGKAFLFKKRFVEIRVIVWF